MLVSGSINIFMIKKTNHCISVDLINKLDLSSISGVGRIPLNEPTGRFFYDPWKLSKKYENSIWEDLYKSLPEEDKGEARIINIDSGNCYTAHCDIDDRYHLNLSGKDSYLIDLEKSQMHLLSKDGCWYEMDAGVIHTAANFGNRPRYQLVVRKLLNDPILHNPIQVKLKINESLDFEDFH